MLDRCHYTRPSGDFRNGKCHIRRSNQRVNSATKQGGGGVMMWVCLATTRSGHLDVNNLCSRSCYKKALHSTASLWKVERKPMRSGLMITWVYMFLIYHLVRIRLCSFDLNKISFVRTHLILFLKLVQITHQRKYYTAMIFNLIRLTCLYLNLC